jgi:hypothetical protein
VASDDSDTVAGIGNPYEAAIAEARAKHGYGTVQKSTTVRRAKEQGLKKLAQPASESRDETWTIRCRTDLKERIKRLADAEEGSSISSLMDEAMEMLLAEREKQGGGAS